MLDKLEVALGEFKHSLSRPKKLSDPSQEYGENCLGKIISKADKQLSGVDYSILFNNNIPCGKNTETMYFLPASFDYLAGLPADHHEMFDEWLDFILKNMPKIESLNLIDSLIILLSVLLEKLTSSYDVVYLNTDECHAKGWGIDHFEYIKGSLIVCGLVQGLSSASQGRRVVESFIEFLLDRNDEAANQWLIEIARECGEEIDGYLSQDELS